MTYYELWVAFLTLIRKEIDRFLRIWTQTLLPSVVTMSLYFAIFGTYIGGQIPSMHGVSYIQFMTPGLLMMTVINNAYMNVSASFFLLKFQRSLDELIVSPMPPFVIILGYAMGGVLRGCITGALVFVVSCFFAPLQVSHPLWVVMIVGLTALCFALAGLINGILAKKFDDINIVPTFILTPLTYLGGVFYSLDTLKPVWKYLSYLNPVVYMVNGLRYGFLGVSDVQISWSFEFLCVLVCIAYGVAHTLLLSGRGLKS